MAGRIRIKRKIAKRKKAPVERTRSRADKVLAQGTGKTVAKAFGNSRGAGVDAWDAFHPCHLPLPRAVGPYTVVRTSALMSSNSKVNLIGTFRRNTRNGIAGSWSTVGCLRSVFSGNPINGFENSFIQSVPFPGANVAGSGLSAVPSAISVQVMNSNPLQSTEGIVAGSVSHTQLDLNGRTETWNDFTSEYISYMRPRLMSAGKLALRGVQMDSYPLNMNACSEFLPVTPSADGVFTWNPDDGPLTLSGLSPAGWAPLVIINNGTPGALLLTFLVTVEWRVRFDIGNPAVSSHTNHGVSTDTQWGHMVNTMVGRGHGVLDIVEKVANTGAAVLGAVQAARGLAGLAL
jgi:hypothetical protein